MAYSFDRPAPKAPRKGLDDRAMAERAEREAARFVEATDSETWTCLCFATPEDLDAFYALVPLPHRRFVTGDELRRATAPYAPAERRRGFPRHPVSMARTPDPLAGVPQTDSLEEDSYAEAEALMAAFRAVRRPEPCAEATDSDIWVCACFSDRSDAEAYLDEMGLRKHGEKYVDASAWLSDLRRAAQTK